jgi:hypothetical protein
MVLIFVLRKLPRRQLVYRSSSDYQSGADDLFRLSALLPSQTKIGQYYHRLHRASTNDP